jgi:hypothetical protein
MTIDTVANLAAAIGVMLAAIALILNLLQFRRLEMSVRGNTYQQLALYAAEIKKLLLEYPELEYLYTKGSGEKRNQYIFERLIGNYLDDAWYQRRHGLIDQELWDTYDQLILALINEHPSIVDLILQPNFSKGFRDHVTQMLAREGNKGQEVKRDAAQELIG